VTAVPATAADRDRVVETFVAAFADDPAVRFFFPDDDSYAGYAATFAGVMFDQRLASGTVWVVEGGAAVAMWDPPVRAADEPPLPFPADVRARLKAYHHGVHAALPTGPHWYLGVLATHPAHAGRRLGRTVMRAGLDRAAADGLPAYLETSTAKNVAIYRSAGWQVVKELPVASTATVDVFILRNDPVIARP
jgi:ribosomal protein S18 acetylase RimI-like enzyme